jgi:predicted nuclease with TOPRIM domain
MTIHARCAIVGAARGKERAMVEVSLEMLQAMVQRLLDGQAELKSDVIEVKERLGLIEGQYASLSRRVDRIGGDVDQIKRRLDLVDVP